MLKIKLLALRKIRGARAMSGAAERGSVHILYYAQRGERSVQTGGSECSNIRPPITPSTWWFCGRGYTTLIYLIFPPYNISSYTYTAKPPCRGGNGGRVYLSTRSPLFEHSAPPVARNIIFERSRFPPLRSATCSLIFLTESNLIFST